MKNNMITIKAYYRTCPFCKERIITAHPDTKGTVFIKHVIEDCKVYKCLAIIRDTLPKTVAEFYELYGEKLLRK